MGEFLYRLMGAATFDAAMYEGIDQDRRATRQATAVVLLTSIAAGIGGGGWYGRNPRSFAVLSTIALVTWFAWSVLMFQIGTRLLPEPRTKSTLGELLRTTGFAGAPGLLLVFATLPRMVIPLFAGISIWMFAAMVVAVRHALHYESYARALAVCGIAASLAVALAVAFGVMFGSVAS